MSERTVQTVTPRQLRREFNGIGLTFLIVFGLAVGAAFGYQWLTPLLEPYYQTAVSYTHLDVYKRQGPRLSI